MRRSSSVPCAAPRLERAICSRFSFSFCSATILSSCTCALLYASTTCSRFESSSWIWARTCLASPSLDSISSGAGVAGPASGRTARARSTKRRACRMVSRMPTPCQGKRALRLCPAPAQGAHVNRASGRAANPTVGPDGAPSLVGCSVRGRRCRRPWIRFAVGGALVLAALLSSSAARADDPATLRSEVERLRAENDGIAARSQAALLDLYSLDTRLRRAESRLTELSARRSRSSARRPRPDTPRARKADVAEAQRRLGIRLSELYIRGEVDPLAVILAAQSLDEALSAFDGLTRLADQDRAILEELRSARVRLQRSVRALGERSAALRQVTARAPKPSGQRSQPRARSVRRTSPTSPGNGS